MKIAELIKKLEETRLEYGNLDVSLTIWFQREGGQDDWVAGDLDGFEIEERTTLCLVADVRDGVTPP